MDRSNSLTERATILANHVCKRNPNTTFQKQFRGAVYLLYMYHAHAVIHIVINDDKVKNLTTNGTENKIRRHHDKMKNWPVA